ncbi:hypothetical protein [Motilimonas pumila]|uniref:DUF4189 domain-containing protein n=1 Tax=Motilimonas pumila TaxID=2303987 RepID=A0A418YBK6_9GAMM|nr:hypothetical protein [Motilimonas pumila]RJG41900.1 hypothetical protein D1Z90_15520 [Motilimonas pumila]
MLKNLFCVLVLLFSSHSWSRSFPEGIKTGSAYEFYLNKYQSKNNSKVFAVSADGAWSAHWGDNLDAISSKALTKCEKSTNEKGSCRLVDINGEAQTALINIEPYRESFHPSPDHIPTNLRSLKAANTYIEHYIPAKGNKAFAVSKSRAFGYMIDQAVSKQVAIDVALVNCRRYNKDFEDIFPCHVAIVNDEVQGETLTLDELNELNKKKKSSVEKNHFLIKDLILNYDLNKFLDYGNSRGHRALVTDMEHKNWFMATRYLDEATAIEVALTNCLQKQKSCNLILKGEKWSQYAKSRIPTLKAEQDAHIAKRDKEIEESKKEQSLTEINVKDLEFNEAHHGVFTLVAPKDNANPVFNLMSQIAITEDKFMLINDNKVIQQTPYLLNGEQLEVDHNGKILSATFSEDFKKLKMQSGTFERSNL